MWTFLISTLQVNSSSYLKKNLSTLVKSISYSAMYFADTYRACEYSWFVHYILMIFEILRIADRYVIKIKLQFMHSWRYLW